MCDTWSNAKLWLQPLIGQILSYPFKSDEMIIKQQKKLNVAPDPVGNISRI